MSNLGSIYDDTVADGKGPDLRASVRVPRSALGAAGGVRVPLPPVLSAGGREIERAVQPGEPRDSVTLHLPTDFPEGATLRLRGGGGRGAAGAGDLFLTIELDDEALVLAGPSELDSAGGTATPVLVGLGIAAVLAIAYVVFV